VYTSSAACDSGHSPVSMLLAIWQAVLPLCPVHCLELPYMTPRVCFKLNRIYLYTTAFHATEQFDSCACSAQSCQLKLTRPDGPSTVRV
jgi:hypothetical protein